jgi:hypothetical protein
MSTNARRGPDALSILLSQIADHLGVSDSRLSPDATAHAIRTWIDADRAGRKDPGPASGRGYRWKTLFLADGAELRMECLGTAFYAKVVGDQIIYQGRSVSPRGMTLAVAGEGRNAWRDLWLKLPGERYWKQAIRCRHEQERVPAKPKQSPAEVMESVAATMSEALKTALALVDHATAQAVRKIERRVDKHRREADTFTDDCAFD